MEEQLKKLLKDLKEREEIREEIRKEELDAFDFQKSRFDDQMNKFDEGMKQDIEDGLYKNTPEYKLQQLIEEEKNKLREKYNNQNNELSDESKKKIEERHVQEKESEYKQISSAIKDYHLDMVLEVNKSNKLLTDIKTERDLKVQEIDKKIAEKETERNAKIEELDKKIAEKEAKIAHLAYFNDIESKETSLDIDVLTQDIKNLKTEKDELSSEEIDNLKTEKDSISNEYASRIEAQNQIVQYNIQQKERAGKVIGQIRLSEKSIDEIYKILFDDKVNEVVDETAKPEQTEQPDVNVEASVVEKPVVEAPVIEEDNSENTTPNGEEGKVDSESKTRYSEFWKRYLDKNVDKNMGVDSETKKRIIEDFITMTGIKENEASKIFGDEKHAKAIAEIATTTHPIQETFKAFRDYYMNIDEKLEIEVSAKGIKYNDEIISPEDMVEIDEKTTELIDKCVKEIEEKTKIVYDRNIIAAIVMDNCKETKEGKMALTASGSKKLKVYAKLIQNPTKEENKEKCSVTYDLTKMSWIDRLLKRTSWKLDMVEEFKEVAYQAKDLYAEVNPGPLTRMQWFIKDKLKEMNIPKLGSGKKDGKDKEENSTVDTNEYNEKNIAKAIGENVRSWILSPKAKEKANEPVVKNDEQLEENEEQPVQAEDGQEH